MVVNGLIDKRNKNKKRSIFKNRQLPLHMMIGIPFVFLIIFKYIPIMGTTMAFQNFIPTKGLFGAQQWVGLENFRYAFAMPNFLQVLWNTLYIAILKILAGLFFPVILALLLDEISNVFFKRTVQTIVYMPHFMSWVILSGILIDVLSPNGGIVNNYLGMLGIKPIFFLGSNKWFPATLIVSNVWKEVGFQTVVYLAVITGISPELYEAAVMDGANRWKQTWHITLTGMRMIIVLMTVLALGRVLDAGFDQILNLYSVQVYDSGDILDTLVYRTGLVNAQYGLSAAINLFKALISLTLISGSYLIAYKKWGYRIF